MARVSKANLHTRYRGRLESAKRFRRDEKLDALWGRMIDLYRGKHWPKGLTDQDRMVVNQAFSTINVIYPSVSVNNPKITVNPTKPEAEDRAVITEAVVNYLWQHYKYQEQFRLSVKDFLMIGHGWLKIGYRFKERELPAEDGELNDAYDQARQQADGFAMERPDLAGDLPTDEEIWENLPATKIVTVEDNPYVERISPFDIYVDPEAMSMQDCRWIAQRIIRTIEDVRADARYGYKARNTVKADAAVRGEDDDRRNRKPDSEDVDMQRVTVWEFYDLAKNTVCSFAQDSDEFLIEPAEIPFASGHPFVMLRNYEIPDYFYPMGDLESLEPLQHELNMLRTQMQQARQKFARKYFYKESTFDAVGIQALQSDKDNTFVPVADENINLVEAAVPLQQVPLPPDLYNVSSIVENDMGTVTGVSEYQRGQVPETRRTATEAAIISDSVNARAADKLSLIERAIGEVASKVIAMAQQFTTGEQMARVIGPQKAALWVPYSREDIEGEYDFMVEGGSTQPMNETVRRQTAQSMMNALAPLLPLGIIDPVELTKYLLQFGYGISNPNRFIMQQPQLPPGGDPNADPNAPAPDASGLDGMGGMVLQPPPMGDNATPAEGDNSGLGSGIVNQLAGQMGLKL
jgi:hypothetical protein